MYTNNWGPILFDLLPNSPVYSSASRGPLVEEHPITTLFTIEAMDGMWDLLSTKSELNVLSHQQH